MAQQNIPIRASVAYVALESPYGTPGAYARDAIVNETVDLSGLQRTETPNMDQRVSLFDHLPPVAGYRSGSKAKYKHYLKAPTAPLISAASPSTSTLGTYLKGLMGGELAAAGSAVATATSTTSVIVTASDGSKFPAGDWALVGVGGVLEPVRVSNRAVDTLTFSLGLSAASAIGQLAVNTYTYYPTNINEASLSVQFGYNLQGSGSADAQWALAGVTGDFGFDFAREKIGILDLDLAIASPSDPSALSLVATPAADGMGPEFPNRSGLLYWQPASTAAKTTSVNWESYSIKVSNGMAHVPSNDASALEGTCAVMRSGDCRPYATITLKARYDLARYTDWLNQTPQQIVLMLSVGTGTTKRWFILDAPNCVPYGMPKTMTEGGRLLMELSFQTMQDSVCGANATTDAALAPLRVAIG